MCYITVDTIISLFSETRPGAVPCYRLTGVSIWCPPQVKKYASGFTEPIHTALPLTSWLICSLECNNKRSAVWVFEQRGLSESLLIIKTISKVYFFSIHMYNENNVRLSFIHPEASSLQCKVELLAGGEGVTQEYCPQDITDLRSDDNFSHSSYLSPSVCLCNSHKKE